MDNDGHRHTPSQPDDGFERLLRAALRADDTAAGSECLDAETLAAWCDGALAPSERSFADAHMARCARCQRLLAVMARTAPVAPVPATWSLRQWLMMLAPAAAATTAIALWFAVEPRRPAEPQPASQVAAREAEADHVPSGAKPAEPPPDAASVRRNEATPPGAIGQERRQPGDARDAISGQARAVPGATAKAEPFGAATAPSSRAVEEKSKLADASAKPVAEMPAAAPTLDNRTVITGTNTGAVNAPMANAPTANAANASSSDAARTAGERRAETPPPPAAPPPPAPGQMAQVQQLPARADQQQADATAQALPRAAAASGRGGSSTARERAGLSELAAAASARLLVASPDASVQWRVVSERIVQHSIDKGASWATQYTVDDKSAIVAGSAATGTAAWLVGRAGLVLVTTDGRTWRRLTFPEVIDLTAVAAVDGRSALVTAADRRVFTTTNGGETWTVKK